MEIEIHHEINSFNLGTRKMPTTAGAPSIRKINAMNANMNNMNDKNTRHGEGLVIFSILYLKGLGSELGISDQSLIVKDFQSLLIHFCGEMNQQALKNFSTKMNQQAPKIGIHINNSLNHPSKT